MSKPFMTQAEQHCFTIIMEQMEDQLMFGNIEYFRKKAKEDLKRLLTEKKVTITQAKSILHMIDSPAQDNLDFAKVIMQTVSTQNIIQDVSHIQSHQP